MRSKLKSREWEIQNSSLAKKSKKAISYDKVRKYACEDIVSNLTRLSKLEVNNVIEIPKGTEFHFIGRVNTNILGDTPKDVYDSFKTREFISFSTISNKNISRYKGRPFFIYDIQPQDIVHIFPSDSCTDKYAKNEQELTQLPSIWLTLKDLNNITQILGVYDQITCKTKRNDEIIQPIAILAINEVTEEVRSISEQFGISIILIHPDEDAVEYTEDLLYDHWNVPNFSKNIENLYDINIKEYFYWL